MLDAKKVARLVLNRISGFTASEFADVDAGRESVDSRVEYIIAEEIDKAQNPKPKTRGQEVAEKAIYIHSDGDAVVFGDSPPVILTRYDANQPNGLTNARDTLRYVFAKLIDAERADAAKQEREACASLLDTEASSHRDAPATLANLIRYRVECYR